MLFFGFGIVVSSTFFSIIAFFGGSSTILIGGSFDGLALTAFMVAAFFLVGLAGLVTLVMGFKVVEASLLAAFSWGFTFLTGFATDSFEDGFFIRFLSSLIFNHQPDLKLSLLHLASSEHHIKHFLKEEITIR